MLEKLFYLSFIFTLNVTCAEASAKMPKQTSALRNAFTDVSLMSEHRIATAAKEPVRISLAEYPTLHGVSHGMSANAKFVWGCVLTSIGTLFLATATFLLISGGQQADSDLQLIDQFFGVIFLIIGLAAGIPGGILVLKYRKGGKGRDRFW
jgi:hypothetical protein